MQATCEFLEEHFECDCRACDCHPVECQHGGCGGEELTCDDYIVNTCSDLEEAGCDCHGCNCAIDECHKSCNGLSCDEIIAMGDDSGAFGHFFGEVTCAAIESQYGCDCPGCSRCEEADFTHIDLQKLKDEKAHDECVLGDARRTCNCD